MKFNKYPDDRPTNGQRIVVFIDTVLSTIYVFNDDIDNWTGKTFDRLDHCSVYDRSFWWLDYNEACQFVNDRG